uniref:Uncharacterized protein n=1 Tax=viral metagenome TaxID=1070528 RepID=A0A6C0E976_9ZZZZ
MNTTVFTSDIAPGGKAMHVMINLKNMNISHQNQSNLNELNNLIYRIFNRGELDVKTALSCISSVNKLLNDYESFANSLITIKKQYPNLKSWGNRELPKEYVAQPQTVVVNYIIHILLIDESQHTFTRNDKYVTQFCNFVRAIGNGNYDSERLISQFISDDNDLFDYSTLFTNIVRGLNVFNGY